MIRDWTGYKENNAWCILLFPLVYSALYSQLCCVCEVERAGGREYQTVLHAMVWPLFPQGFGGSSSSLCVYLILKLECWQEVRGDSDMATWNETEQATKVCENRRWTGSSSGHWRLKLLRTDWKLFNNRHSSAVINTSLYTGYVTCCTV